MEKVQASRIVKDISPREFVKAYAAHLKRSGKIELPHWTDIVKTGVHKELAPYDPDWYYIRAASMARKIYLRGGLGVGAFRRIYGGRKRNGSRPPHLCKSGGAIARHILQQLQDINIIDIDPKGGRRITSSGQRDLDQKKWTWGNSGFCYRLCLAFPQVLAMLYFQISCCLFKDLFSDHDMTEAVRRWWWWRRHLRAGR
ncbi:hypothetical protein Nepgr_028864 [Nepenthes gracilis]|uniref:Uncharacterized protein n=1 Tax=Nepenthes gracilis TaxID=150966 RepID=A0AAD3TDU1_NEPGR|nr:hypothetical protein Nepgr_028864 [Nepenthes gracilis]